MTAIRRVLQIANRAGPLQLFMLPLCKALTENGMEVELACMPGGTSWRQLPEHGFKVHWLPEGDWKSPATWLRLHRAINTLLRDRKYDLVIVHTPAISWIVRPAAARFSGMAVYFAHGLPFAPEQNALRRSAYLMIEKYMARYTDGIIVMNTDDARACKEFRLTRPAGRCGYIPGIGIDIDKWSATLTPAQRSEWTNRLKLRDGKPVVLFLGRFIDAKRPQDVLECADRLANEADFVMAGEGPLWPWAKRKAARVGTHVHVLEFTSRPSELMMLCDIVVLPSVFREGLPRVLLEACAAARPIVAYNIRGVRDIVQDGKNGYLIAPRNVEELGDKLTELVRDASLRDSMGQSGRRIVEDAFTVDHSIAAILSFLNLPPHLRK